MNIDLLKFDEKGLIPAIIQHEDSKEVLMLAYMNKESLKLTISSGYTHFWSRSRRKLWKKGETSGNLQKVKEIQYDCDNDTLLIKVSQKGVACHTGNISCFYSELYKNEKERVDKKKPEILDMVYETIIDRKKNRNKDSYVVSLFDKGQDQILKKIAEEAGEVIIGSKNGDRDEIIWEVADLWFHTLVLLGYHDISSTDIYNELGKRFGKKGKKQQ